MYLYTYLHIHRKLLKWPYNSEDGAVVIDCCAGDEGVGGGAKVKGEEDGCGDERRLVCGISSEEWLRVDFTARLAVLEDHLSELAKHKAEARAAAAAAAAAPLQAAAAAKDLAAADSAL
jgi:hypothetical protein